MDNNIKGDAIFGPAYKGIPLAIATGIILNNKFGVDMNYCFDRKEVKDHGEGGMIIGYQFGENDTLVFVDDVITSGKALRESMEKIKGICNANVKDMVISVDRMEKGRGEKSAQSEIKEAFGITTYPIVTMAEVVEYLYNREINGTIYIDDNIKLAIEEYYQKYGV